ncbi:arsenic resistance protein [Belnapia rosea]|uniref:Arsenite efflux pump ArsB, ACR3 family n=1 Tax=Belnapia rosea TaxID=938405 RepID=A0A1G6YYY5_9PROT|nr:arsenic resistance protein [Belnapia rosea]SDD95558.1 Arsenite efflux pump ArsB, ACR3 family [Belnapia rosea]
MSSLREILETHQVAIYFAAVAAAALVGLLVPGAMILEATINPALAVMLFVTFLQVPLDELGRALVRVRFVAALLIANFVVIPGFVLVLAQFLPSDPMIQLGVLLVLLAPCIDYVVTFSQIGRADARLLLASTPALLLLQMLLLPLYLGLFLGDDAAGLVQAGPFLHAFVWLIAGPLVLAGIVRTFAARIAGFAKMSSGLSLLPVPATAIVLFVVIASVTPQLGLALDGALRALPLYVAYAAIAPLLGWGVARLVGLEAPAGRAVAFSAGTRNSLVVLPLAFAVPGAVPVLPAVIVMQTLVELVASLAYMRLIPKLGSQNRNFIASSGTG